MRETCGAGRARAEPGRTRWGHPLGDGCVGTLWFGAKLRLLDQREFLEDF